MADTDADLRESMSAFEAALEAREVRIEEPAIERVLMALDQSNQDATVEAIAVEIVRRHDASLHVVYAYEGERDEASERYLEERCDELAKRLEANERVTVQAAHSTQKKSFEKILEVGERERCDLILVCSPYLDDLRVLGRESVGTNLDMLLYRSKVPVLVVREPLDDVAEALEHVLLPVTFHDEENVKAAGWALRLVAASGGVRLLIVADAQVLESASHLLGGDVDARELDEGTLRGLENKEHAGLIAALQRHAAHHDLGCHVSFRVGEPVPVVAGVAKERPCVIVTGCPQKRVVTGYQQVLALIRESSRPVLVV